MSSRVFYGHLSIVRLAAQQGPPTSCPVESNGYWVSCQWLRRTLTKRTWWWCWSWWTWGVVVAAAAAVLTFTSPPHQLTNLIRQTSNHSDLHLWPHTVHNLSTLTRLFITRSLEISTEVGPSSIRPPILHPAGDDAIWEQCNHSAWSNLRVQQRD